MELIDLGKVDLHIPDGYFDAFNPECAAGSGVDFHENIDNRIHAILASMPGDDLIAAFCSGTHNNRYEDSIALYALRCAFHMNIIYHMERMILEWVELCQRQLNHLFRAIPCMDGRIPIFVLSGGTTLCLSIHFDFLLSSVCRFQSTG